MLVERMLATRLLRNNFPLLIQFLLLFSAFLAARYSIRLIAIKLRRQVKVSMVKCTRKGLYWF